MRLPTAIPLVSATLALVGCARPEPRFPLREPMRRDDDSSSVWVACHPDPSRKDPRHVSCAPVPTYNAFIWDAVDNVVFRPFSDALRVPGGARESTDVSSLDEVPDSSWFTNRLGIHPMTPEELELGRCTSDQILDGATAPDGAWVIDKGKMEGVTDGFGVTVPGKGRFLFKADDKNQPEHASAAQTVGVRVYHAAGYFVPCEQVVYFRPSVFTLKPHLRYKRQFEDEKDFGQKELDAIFAHSPRRGDLVRMQASAWLPGYGLGGFHYEGTRADDPNDVIAHEDRRELRGKRLLNAWLDRVDDRLANTLDTWMTDRPGPADGSPGHVIHNLLDTSECFGIDYNTDEVTKRVGFTYVWDWRDIGIDLGVLGTRKNVWETTQKTPGEENFFYFNVRDFVPENWKNEYPIAAFSRMTERDGAWMARILARFTPGMVDALARMADYTKPEETAYLRDVLEGRLEKILERYLTRLSPITDVHVEGTSRLCGVDLAEWRRLREPKAFRYTANVLGSVGGRSAWTTVERPGRAEVCVTLPHVAADGGLAADDASRYMRVRVDDGVANGPLIAHLYDLGPVRGFRLAGLQRPER
jgi:hypothetical protein